MGIVLRSPTRFVKLYMAVGTIHVQHALSPQKLYLHLSLYLYL